VLKTQGSRATLYLHGLSDYPLSEIFDDTTNIEPATRTQFIYGLGGLIATVVNGQTQFVFKDHLGSTRVPPEADRQSSRPTG
jgi:hypothetical protein